jgi:hypothetical protein
VTTQSRRGRTDWLAGLVVGAGAGLLLAEWPTAGALIAIGFAVPAAASRQRLAALGGLLVGLPASWLAVIWQAAARCAAFSGWAGQECIWPDLTGWITVAVGLFLVGAAVTALAVRKSGD